MFVFINDADKSLHWFRPLSFTLFVTFPFDGMVRGAQAEKYKHTLTHTHTCTRAHIAWMYTRALHSRAISIHTYAEGASERAGASKSNVDGENSVTTNASPIPSEKSLNRMYLACFPFIHVFFSIYLCHLFGCLQRHRQQQIEFVAIEVGWNEHDCIYLCAVCVCYGYDTKCGNGSNGSGDNAKHSTHTTTTKCDTFQIRGKVCISAGIRNFAVVSVSITQPKLQ